MDPTTAMVSAPVITAPKNPNAMDLLSIALNEKAAIDVIERLAALQERERYYHATVDFDEAMNRVQGKLGRVSADVKNSQTNSWYATYAKLDKVVRPVYVAEGFSISFGERDCPIPGKTRFVAYLSRAGVTREYLKDMTPSTKGPKGQDFMTPIHADGAADSYAKRYLLKDIFNIAIGEDDSDGNTNGELQEQLEWVSQAGNLEELAKLFRQAYKQFEANPAALRALVDAKNKRKEALK